MNPRTALALTLALLATGCGTMVDTATFTPTEMVTDGRGGEGVGPDAEATADDVDMGTGVAAPAGGAPAQGGPATGAPSGTTAPGPQGPGAGAGETAPPAPQAVDAGQPAVDSVVAAPVPGTLQVGVYVVSDNTDEYFQSIGVNIQVGDGVAQSNALVEEVNATGGLGGHPIEPVFHVADLTDTRTPSEQGQAACTDWVEDHDVVAVVTAISGFDETLLGCLTDHGVPLIGSGLQPHDAANFSEHPSTLYVPWWPTMDRSSPALVDSLVARGFFGEAPVIGLIRRDSARYDRATENALRPALAVHGLEVTEEVEASASDVGAFVAQSQAAVLRFRAAGVSHVLFLDGGGGIQNQFMPAAEQQGYRPRYALTSHDGPAAYASTAIPPQQLVGAMGVGFQPLIDVAIAEAPATPGRDRCFAIMEEAGQDMGQQAAASLATNYCDGFFFLQQAVGGEEPALQAIVDGVSRLGTGFASAAAFATRFSADRHDGAAAFRDLAFDADCTCFVYTSDLEPLP